MVCLRNRCVETTLVKFSFSEKATKIWSYLPLRFDVTNFFGLLRKLEFYENVKMKLHRGFENFVLFWSAKKYVCARRGFRVRAPFPPIDMSKTFFGSFSCLLAGWISLLFFSIHFFFFLILSTKNFYNFLTILLGSYYKTSTVIKINSTIHFF